MARLFYLLPLVTGIEPRPHARVPKYIFNQGLRPNVMDMGLDDLALVRLDADQTIHDLLDQQSDVFAISDNPDVTLVPRDVMALSNALTARNLPAQWVTAGMSYRDALAQIAGMFQFAQRYTARHGLSLREVRALDTEWDSLPVATRQRLIDTADSFGNDRTELASGRDLDAIIQDMGAQFPDKIVLGGEQLKSRTRIQARAQTADDIPLFFAQTVVGTDAFTGTNNTLLPTYSSNWAAVRGNMRIQSNAVRPDGSEECSARWTDTFDDDQYSTGTIVALVNVQQIGVSVRNASGAQSFYFYVADPLFGSYFGKYVSGSVTYFAEGGDAWEVDDVVLLEAEGTTITPYVNTVEDSSVGGATTDSSLSSGYAGVAGYDSNTGARLDDWEGGDLGGAPSANPKGVFGLPLHGPFGGPI